MATISNLYIDQGSTFNTSLNVNDQTGEPLDLSDYTAAAQMRRSYYTNTYIDLNATISSPLDGEVSISLSASESGAVKAGRYVYDIEITGNGETMRVLEGIIVVNPEVTR